jgi:hypothetical protein
MMRLKWKNGSVSRTDGTFMLSATRFTYRSLIDMPGVFWHGLGLRKSWSRIEGAVGVFLAGDFLKRTTYTVSVWNAEVDLHRWLASPDHARLMRLYRRRMQSSAAVSWNAEGFVLRDVYREGMARLVEKERAT